MPPVFQGLWLLIELGGIFNRLYAMVHGTDFKQKMPKNWDIGYAYTDFLCAYVMHDPLKSNFVHIFNATPTSDTLDNFQIEITADNSLKKQGVEGEEKNCDFSA